jgi:hypothetical protein
MIVKKVKVLKDMNFRNALGSYMLTKDQIISIPFNNQNEYEAHYKLGHFQSIGEGVSEQIVIPIIRSAENIENPLLDQFELTGNLDKLKPVYEEKVQEVEEVKVVEPVVETKEDSAISNMAAYEAALKELEKEDTKEVLED